MRHEGKRVLVSGGSSGIGKAVALRFARDGADVFISGAPNDAGDVDATIDDLCALGSNASGVSVDVADPTQIGLLVDQALAHLGGLDVLVSNAGTYWPQHFLEITEEGWDRLMAVNLRSMFLLGQRAARHMVDAGRGGSIINTASTNGILGDENAAHYNTSKAGVIGLTKSMAVDLAPHRIRVNAVCPGMVLTRMSGTMSEAEDVLDVYARRIPADRFGTVDEAAGIYSFLASEDALYITGDCVVVDGGLTAGLRWRGWVT